MTRWLPGLLVLLFLAGITTPASSVASNSVYLAESDNHRINQMVRDHFRTRFGDERRLQTLPESPAEDALILTVGPDALNRARQRHPDNPRIALFVPDLEFDRSQGVESAIFSNPPLLRQARLGQLIVPSASRIALLSSPAVEEQLEPLVDQLKEEGFDARVFEVPDQSELIRRLGHALNYGDFLLGTTDDRIYNRQTIKHLLLTSYRNNRVLIGPSRAFVQAGAVASTYTEPVDQIREGLMLVERFLRTDSMPPPSFPREFSVAVNHQVARSLNMVLPDTDTMVDALRRSEVRDE